MGSTGGPKLKPLMKPTDSSSRMLGAQINRDPGPRKSVYGASAFGSGKMPSKTKQPDLHIKKSEIKNFNNLLKKIHDLAEQYTKEELEEKTGILVQLYQKINKIVPAHENFFETFREKYEDLRSEYDMLEFQNDVESKCENYDLYLNSVKDTINDLIEESELKQNLKMEANLKEKDKDSEPVTTLHQFRIRQAN